MASSQRSLFVSAVFLLPSVLCCHVSAQTSSGAISGRVTDASGAAVPNAEVRLVNQATNDARALMTRDAGDYIFPDVQPGTFKLIVKANGFKQYERTDLHLSSSDNISADMQLQIGAITEKVEVIAQGSMIQLTSADRSALIDSKQITDLMARGRDVMSLLQLMPGVVNDANGSDTLGQFSTPTMAGTRQYYNALNIDGISGNTARGRTAESPINMDAISEVKVLQNSYPAEYGSASGGVINIVTKGGTQSFHGSAYYYNRNEGFNGNNFFNNRAANYVPRPRYRFNTTGYNVGGPIYWPNHFNASKQKLFFFFSQEILPNESPNATSYFTVPTGLERQGNYSKILASKKIAVKYRLKAVRFTNNII